MDTDGLSVDEHRNVIVEALSGLAEVHFPILKKEPKARWMSSEAWGVRSARVEALKVIKENHRAVKHLLLSFCVSAWIRGVPACRVFVPETLFISIDREIAARHREGSYSDAYLSRTAYLYKKIRRHDRAKYLDDRKAQAMVAIEKGETKKLFAVFKELRPKKKRPQLTDWTSVACRLKVATEKAVAEAFRGPS